MKVWVFWAAWVIWAVAIQHQGVTANNDGTLIKMFSDGVESAYKTDVNQSDAYEIVSRLGGSKKYCLEAVNNVAKVEGCQSHVEAQKWFLKDHTIHTRKDDKYCLTANDVRIGSDILILPCGGGLSKRQQWNYDDGDEAYVNLASGNLVLDVADSNINDLSRQRIIIWSANKEKNQKWYTRRA